jgi:hypothetical protein
VTDSFSEVNFALKSSRFQNWLSSLPTLDGTSIAAGWIYYASNSWHEGA